MILRNLLLRLINVVSWVLIVVCKRAEVEALSNLVNVRPNHSFLSGIVLGQDTLEASFVNALLVLVKKLLVQYRAILLLARLLSLWNLLLSLVRG